MWKILTIIASISMIISFFRGRNAIWGGATIGLIIGTIVAIFQRFNWPILYKAIVIGILVGLIADLLGVFSDFLKKIIIHYSWPVEIVKNTSKNNYCYLRNFMLK